MTVDSACLFEPESVLFCFGKTNLQSASVDVCLCVFFFQAEDGIRDYKVTGVQTCALPICEEIRVAREVDELDPILGRAVRHGQGQDHRDVLGSSERHRIGKVLTAVRRLTRSEERRVGKECRSRWSPYH